MNKKPVRMNINGVAEYLGCSTRTVERLNDAGELGPPHRDSPHPTGTRYWMTRNIEKFIERRDNDPERRLAELERPRRRGRPKKKEAKNG